MSSGDPRRVLGVDLASGAWRDNGTALLTFDDDRWLTADLGVLAWPRGGRPDASSLADRIDAFCLEHSVDAVSIDGPQGWRDPHTGTGWGRRAEREARTPGKMGPPKTCVPGTYLGWVSLSVELFALLRERSHVALVNERATRVERRSGGYYLIESFPTSTWRTAGLTALPAKAKTRSTAAYARALENAFALPSLGVPGHDDLQAVVAALPAAALLGAPADPVPRGVAGRDEGSAWVEGIIWDAEPAQRRRRTDAAIGAPLLVVVTGPPAAGKTTIARAVADRLELPLIAKDTLKERLHDALGGEGREASLRLGRATFDVLFLVAEELLRGGVSVVVEGNFGPWSVERFAALPPARIVQVHVSAPPAVLAERLATRDGRHPVHYDRAVVEEVPQRAAAGEWDALPIAGALVAVDTASFPDVAALADRVAGRTR